MAVPKKKTSKSKKKMRQTAWKQKVQKQALQALFTAKFLLRNKPEDPAIEKLLTRMRDNENSQPEENSTASTEKTEKTNN